MVESITQLMQHLALIQYINTGMHFLTRNFKMIWNLKFKTFFPFILACLLVRVSCYTRYSEMNPMKIGGGGPPTPVVFFLNNLKTAYIRTLKLLQLFNIIVVNKFC